MLLLIVSLGAYFLIVSYGRKDIIKLICIIAAAIMFFALITKVIFGVSQRLNRPLYPVTTQNIQIILEVDSDTDPPKLNHSVAELLGVYTKTNPPIDYPCGICFESLIETLNDQIIACPSCKKSAHQSCIQNWLESGQAVCIYCRYNLPDALID
jgi:hypothetical protein